MFRGCVAVAEDQQIHLLRRIACLLDLDEPARRGRSRTIDEQRIRRIDGRRPDLVEGVARIALLQQHPHGRVGHRKPHGFVEGAVGSLRLIRRLPFAIHRREPARVQHLFRLWIDDLEEILAQVGVVD
jgi:hypothetical protein